MNKLIQLLNNLLGITDAYPRSTDTRKMHAQPRFTEVWDVDGVVVVRFFNLNTARVRFRNGQDR
jgi:hypothetical protein